MAANLFLPSYSSRVASAAPSIPAAQVRGVTREQRRQQTRTPLRRAPKPRPVRRQRSLRGYSKSSPRDARFSDQQKLRRMYRNG